MNSQIVSINEAVRSKNTLYALTALIPISLFLTSGFVSVSIIWFFAMCMYNHASPLRGRFRMYRLLFFPIALFALNLPWLFFTRDLTGTIDLVLRKIHLLLIPAGLIMVNRKISEKAVNVILALFLLSCLIASFICLAAAIINIIRHQSVADLNAEPPGFYFSYYSLTKPINIPPVYLSLFCNFAFVIGLHSPFIHSQARRFLALYLGIFIIMISSIVGVVTFVVISLIWLAGSRYKNLARYLVGGLVIIGIVISFYSFPVLRHQFEPDFREQSGDLVTTIPARLAIWSLTWKAIEQKPLFGQGPGDGQKALEEVYKQENFLWGVREALNPHNEFLSVFLDLGAVGFCLLLGGMGYTLILSIRRRARLRVCFIILIFLFFCFESVLVRQKGIVFFSIFYSLLFGNFSLGSGLEPRR